LVMLQRPFPLTSILRPILPCFSNMVTEQPASAAKQAAMRPEAPPPITATRFDNVLTLFEFFVDGFFELVYDTGVLLQIEIPIRVLPRLLKHSFDDAQIIIICDAPLFD